MAAQPTTFTSISSASIATADGNNSRYPYDVFINHGPEVNKTLASQLYYRLLVHGLRVFKSEGDKLTCEIESAIRNASVHIAIFSTKFAESVGCMDELLLMLESGSTIIPVFYGVQPSDLRGAERDKGVYAAALRILETNRTRENKPGYKSIIRKWRKALSHMADISGVTMEACNGDEGKLVDKVAKGVLESLKEVVGYDVFISHRGSDVKKTLASHLYNRLILHELGVFLDREELREGKKLTCQIEGAIRTSSVHIAIFSPKYAESRWCLNELVLMLESGSAIIPVFYGVNRWRPGRENRLYAQALLHRALRIIEERKSLDPQKQLCEYEFNSIEKWRKALSDVAEIDGVELDTYNCDEGQLVDQVVRRVLRKVRKTPLVVATYPIGLNEKVKELETTLSKQKQRRKAKVAGIVGRGGVGKTTLAKEFFNRHRSNYDRCCFLSVVKEDSLNCLQSRLLKDLTQRSLQIENIDEGKEKLKRYRSSFDTLIILDDVDRIEQLEALFLPMKNVLNSSSTILVTSRHMHVLISAGFFRSSIYRLEGLSARHSEQLFCWHAFGRPHPEARFENVVEMILKVCGGLPLPLKVFGELVDGKHNLEYWEERLYKITPILPYCMHSWLKSSYEGLDSKEKQIFLDIVFFFIGKDKPDTAIRIWDGDSWEGSFCLGNKENKVFLEVGSRMHDLDSEREIAEKECARRLWNLLRNVSDRSLFESLVRLSQQCLKCSKNAPVKF